MNLLSSNKITFSHKPRSKGVATCCPAGDKQNALGTLKDLGKSIIIGLALLSGSPGFAQSGSTETGASTESPIKFALFSAAWGENTDDGLRLVAQNLSQEAITLEKISFIDLPRDNQKTDLTLRLGLRAERYAQTNLPLVDLLTGDDCVARTMADGWKLVEISNYTLNPSVRNLIIENTNSFRIYQCVRAAKLTWRSDADAASTELEGWVLYHFESRSN